MAQDGRDGPACAAAAATLGSARPLAEAAVPAPAADREAVSDVEDAGGGGGGGGDGHDRGRERPSSASAARKAAKRSVAAGRCGVGG